MQQKSVTDAVSFVFCFCVCGFFCVFFCFVFLGGGVCCFLCCFFLNRTPSHFPIVLTISLHYISKTFAMKTYLRSQLSDKNAQVKNSM